MDVSQILKLLATLSIGLDDPTDSDIVVFMQFINLCYFELLQSTIAQNPLISVTHETLDCTDGDCEPTATPIFIPKVVYDVASNEALSGTTFDEVIKNDPGFTNTNGVAQEWFYSGGIISVYPVVTSLVADGNGIGIRYIPQPAPLTVNSLSSDILIPYMYQQVLADGASYYLFQSETGFKDQTKMQASMARWMEGKQKLFAYMKNVSGKKTFSTYSPV